MSRRCDLSGCGGVVGHKVSKSKIKTKRLFLPNLHPMTLKSDVLKKEFKLKLKNRVIRTVLKYGSLDEYLLNTKAGDLSVFGLTLRRRIKKIVPRFKREDKKSNKKTTPEVKG